MYAKYLSRKLYFKFILKVSFVRAITHIIKNDPDLIEGNFGYKAVATCFCQGNMKKAYKLVSAICKANSLDFKKLNWGNQQILPS